MPPFEPQSTRTVTLDTNELSRLCVDDVLRTKFINWLRRRRVTCYLPTLVLMELFEDVENGTANSRLAGIRDLVRNAPNGQIVDGAEFGDVVAAEASGHVVQLAVPPQKSLLGWLLTVDAGELMNGALAAVTRATLCSGTGWRATQTARALISRNRVANLAPAKIKGPLRLDVDIFRTKAAGKGGRGDWCDAYLAGLGSLTDYFVARDLGLERRIQCVAKTGQQMPNMIALDEMLAR